MIIPTDRPQHHEVPVNDIDVEEIALGLIKSVKMSGRIPPYKIEVPKSTSDDMIEKLQAIEEIEEVVRTEGNTVSIT